MKTVFAAIALCTLAGTASAGLTYGWNYNGPGQNNTAGTPQIQSTFNTANDVFTWNVQFADGVSKDTDGYWLVVSPGPNPKNHQHEFGIIYFDASNINNVKATIYRYNGQNSDNSFQNPGQLLASTLNSSADIVTATASQTGSISLHRAFTSSSSESQ